MPLKYKKGNKKIYIFLVVASIAVFLISASVLPFINGMGRLPSADWCLCLVCIMPLLIPFKPHCVFAVCLGFLCDLFVSTPSDFSPIVYLAAAMITSFLLGRFAKKGAVVAGVCGLPAFALRSLVGCVGTFVDFGTDVMSLLSFAVSEMCVNLAVCIALGAVIGLIVKGTRIGTAV